MLHHHIRNFSFSLPNDQGRAGFQAGPGGRGVFTRRVRIQDSGSPVCPSPMRSPWRDPDNCTALGCWAPLSICCPRPSPHCSWSSQDCPLLPGTHLGLPGKGHEVPLAHLRWDLLHWPLLLCSMETAVFQGMCRLLCPLDANISLFPPFLGSTRNNARTCRSVFVMIKLEHQAA